MIDTKTADPKLFISYSWTTPDHEAWVLQFAEELTSQGIHVILDKWDLQPGHDANAFMESMVSDPTVTKVLLICDEMYARKSDGRKGGAGTEAQIITPEIYAHTAQDKFAAVVRERDGEGKPFLPVYYKGRIYFDLTSASTYATEFDRIVRWAWGQQLHVRPQKGQRPSFLEGKTVSGKILSSAAHRRAMEAVRTGASNAVPAVREYLDIIAEGLEAFRLRTEHATRETFDDQVVASIEEFTPYRNEIVELFSVIARYSHAMEYLESLHRFFEKCIPYFDRPENVQSWSEWDFDNYRFIIHELFLYCVGIFLQHERFDAAQWFFDNEYYWDDRRERDNKMHAFTVFRETLRSLDHRNQRNELRRLSLRADMLKDRNAGTGIDFQHVMCADFVAYLRGERLVEWRKWWPETLLYADRFSGPFEIFARAKSQRYFDKIKNLLGIGSKDELGAFLEALLQKDRLPRWQFETLDPIKLVGLANIATTP
ncbi:TIR domain-containing protein [Rhizobium sp. CB3171]|uniref:SEFIR domain-containing protein n=1 Tax=Rhizobium sp. CB3171 TaxID=3039157 RepID=UPI0024B13085|nr:SEFIR domain-containing protein [Rhizobium sp. CB3171]WFU01954.1 TIR domain-containing protein [Rhizobium sp. CB3171]